MKLNPAFSRGERIAITILSGLLILVSSIRIPAGSLSEDEVRRMADSLWTAPETAGPTWPSGPAGMAEMVELNSASTEDLEALPGIGPAFSSRIIKYRNLLGGFVRVEQLSEVYGMKPDVVDVISGMVTVDSTLIRPMMLDTVSFKTLLRHPYADYDDVKEILSQRDRHKRTSFVLLRGVIPDTLYCKLSPYLK